MSARPNMQPSSAPRVGVLALQGGFEPHLRMLASLGVEAREVRRPAQLADLTHLVLPGGESTTLHHLLALLHVVAVEARSPALQ